MVLRFVYDSILYVFTWAKETITRIEYTFGQCVFSFWE
jgi:hypothetical protein